MAAKMERVEAGIYRRGTRYAVIYRDPDGKQRQKSARTLDEARRERRRLQVTVDEGSYTPPSRTTLAEYAREWVESYAGTSRGFSENTRAEYAADLDRYVIPRLGKRQLAAVAPRDVSDLVTWLCDARAQGERVAAERRAREARRRGVEVQAVPMVEAEPVHLADATVRRILAPLRSCLRTAMQEGLIRSNPVSGVSLPARDEARRIEAEADDLGDDDATDVKVLTDQQLAVLLATAPAQHRALFRLLAVTGVRISEALALRWGDLDLEGPPAVRVRRAVVRKRRREPGCTEWWRFKAPKSKYGRRKIPLDGDVARELRVRRVQAVADGIPAGARDLVFPARDGRPLDYGNLMHRSFKPAAEEAGAPWAGFHTLRHTCASRLFADGNNPVQVQRWLGHHSPAFTMNTYVHLLEGDEAKPVPLPTFAGASTVSASRESEAVRDVAEGLPEAA